METFNEIPTKRSYKRILKVSGIIVAIAVVVIVIILTLPSKEERLQRLKEERRLAKQAQMENAGENTTQEEITGSGTTAGAGSSTTTSTAGSVSQSEIYGVTTKTDVTYGTGGSTALKLDVYMPSGVSSPTPAILFIHGGGFKGGSKGAATDDGPMLAKHGVAVVSVDYRLSGTAIFPAPLYDVKGAVRFVKAHASEYNIDPNAIFSLGESAGGVLASLLGVTEGNATLEGSVGGNLGYTSNVVGVINISGSYVASIVDTMSPGIKNAISAETGCDPVPSTQCESTYEALSPETYINSGDSPFIILHGDKDGSVPTIQATTLDSKLGAVGVASEIYVASDLAHVGGLLSRYLTQVISFINANS